MQKAGDAPNEMTANACYIVNGASARREIDGRLLNALDEMIPDPASSAHDIRVRKGGHCAVTQLTRTSSQRPSSSAQAYKRSSDSVSCEGGRSAFACPQRLSRERSGNGCEVALTGNLSGVGGQRFPKFVERCAAPTECRVCDSFDLMLPPRARPARAKCFVVYFGSTRVWLANLFTRQGGELMHFPIWTAWS